jgi:hypothetical protein
MANVTLTNITPPRVPLTDQRTGLISREWYRFFLNLFELTGGGQNTTSLTDLQVGPPFPTQEDVTEINVDIESLEKQPSEQSALDQIAELEKQIQGLETQVCCQVNEVFELQKQIQSMELQRQPELGTLSQLQQDNVPWLQFDTTPDTVPPDTGTMAWNQTEQTADLNMDYGVTQQIGLEYYARVENTTGVTIPNGTVVGFAGVGANNTIAVAPYLADGATPSLYVLGVMTHDLPNAGEIGYCTVWGHVKNLDTSAFNVGDILYASPSVAGGLTNVKPTAPENVIPIAAVLAVGVTDGEIFVRPTIEQEQYYGEFTKTGASTSPASANTSYAITWDNTEIANGVSIVSGSQLTVVESGLYQFDVTLQLSSGNSNDKNVRFWFKKNGTNIANTTRIVTVNINNGFTPIALSDFFSLDAGDYVELWWQSDNTSVALVTDAAGGTAPNDYPAAPAGIVAVNQIQL